MKTTIRKNAAVIFPTAAGLLTVAVLSISAVLVPNMPGTVHSHTTAAKPAVAPVEPAVADPTPTSLTGDDLFASLMGSDVYVTAFSDTAHAMCETLDTNENVTYDEMHELNRQGMALRGYSQSEADAIYTASIQSYCPQYVPGNYGIAQ